MTLTDVTAEQVLLYMETFTAEDAEIIRRSCPQRARCLAELRHHESPTGPVTLPTGRRTLGH